MDGLPRLKHQGELRRLLRYLRPYTPLLAGGIFLMMAMGAIEFLTAFSIRPALDVVLNSQSTAQKLTLFQIPWNGHTVYLNSFVPARIRHVWSVFALALVSLFFMKGLAEFFCGRLIEYVGLFAITGLRQAGAAAGGILSRQSCGTGDVRGDQRRGTIARGILRSSGGFLPPGFFIGRFYLCAAGGGFSNGYRRGGADCAGSLPGGKIRP